MKRIASQPVIGLLHRIALKCKAFSDRELADWLIARSKQPERARQTLQQPVSQNLLVADNDRISASLHADIDALRLNGQAMPPAPRQVAGYFSE